MVTLDEYLQYMDKRHTERMTDIQKKEAELKNIPYIDNIPL